MSENKPEHKDRSAITTALIGAGAVIVTALISSILAPIVLRSFDSSPTPLVITTTPAATNLAQATPIPPTSTIAPTATSLPTDTIVPTATKISPTPANITSLVLVNNLSRVMDFYVDDVKATSIDSGTYQVLPIPFGAHEFKQCVYGADTTNPDNCFAKTARLSRVIDYWEMFENLSAGNLQTTLTLIVLNQNAAPQDIYMDGILTKSVAANSFIPLTGPGGLHTLEHCPLGETLASGNCSTRFPLQLGKKIEIFTISGEPS